MFYFWNLIQIVASFVSFAVVDYWLPWFSEGKVSGVDRRDRKSFWEWEGASNPQLTGVIKWKPACFNMI